jgi:ribonuclease HI
MAETLACKFALEAAEVHGISRIEMETDSSLLREAPFTNSWDLAPEGVLFKGIQELLADHFICNRICNVPRSCNSVAHEIARMGMSGTRDNLLFGWTPSQTL